jgi:hypothetical protein
MHLVMYMTSDAHELKQACIAHDLPDIFVRLIVTYNLTERKIRYFVRI